MVSHAAYQQVTHDRAPASLSKVWITDILRKRIGFRNLIVSDDLEMGGVLSAAPIGEVAVEFVRAGGDLCLICHREDYILQAHEALVAEAERDSKFARRVAEAARRVAERSRRRMPGYSAGCALEPLAFGSCCPWRKLTRGLWEFGEELRLDAFSRRGDKRSRRAHEKKGETKPWWWLE